MPKDLDHIEKLAHEIFEYDAPKDRVWDVDYSERELGAKPKTSLSEDERDDYRQRARNEIAKGSGNAQRS